MYKNKNPFCHAEDLCSSQTNVPGATGGCLPEPCVYAKKGKQKQKVWPADTLLHHQLLQQKSLLGMRLSKMEVRVGCFYFQKCDRLGLEQSPLLFFESTICSLYAACPWLNHHPVKVFVSESVIKRASCTTKTLHLHCFQFSDPKQSQMRVHVTMAWTGVWPEQGSVIWTKLQRDACFSSSNSGQTRGRESGEEKERRVPRDAF